MPAQPKAPIGDLLLIDPVEFHLLPQHEQQFLAPAACQAFGNFRRDRLHAGLGQRGQLPGIASPFKMAPMIAIPLTPLISLSTWLSCMFISINAVCMG